MRSFLTGLLGLAAAVLFPLGVVASWLSGVVGDTDAYVETVAPLARDEGVQDAVADRIAVELTRRMPALEVAGPAVRTGVKAVVAGPVFPPAWEASNRSAHRQLVEVLEEDSDGEVRLNLTRIAQATVDEVDATGLIAASGAQVPPVNVTVADSEQLDDARWYYGILEALGPLVPAAAVLCAIGVLALARRRLTALAALGLVTGLTFGATVLLLRGVRQGLVDSVPTRDEVLAGAVWDVLTKDVNGMLLLGLVVAVMLGAGAGIGAAVAGRRP